MKCSPPHETLPLPAHNSRRNLNVVLFGERGVGKSSVINLLAGHVVAETSSRIRACTLQSEEYEMTVNGRTYCVWDTVGLVDAVPLYAPGHIDNHTYAVEHVHLLIQMLSQRGAEVDLLLLCMRGGRITRFTQQLYRLFCDVLCKGQVPIAAVITHLEYEENMEQWWECNVKNLINRYGMGFVGHACVTTLPPESSNVDAQQIAESRRAMLDLLRAHNDRVEERESSSSGFFNSLGMYTPPKRLEEKKLHNALTKRCGYNADLACQIAEILERD
ncbi:P-loop containing nucleoside triphosphate hydrolase protein [Melanogaster broomeanus]|nr:P-loop containing nucleoside triphosphate hydrolase protein [Melanogaster broomeanus]